MVKMAVCLAKEESEKPERKFRRNLLEDGTKVLLEEGGKVEDGGFKSFLLEKKRGRGQTLG